MRHSLAISFSSLSLSKEKRNEKKTQRERRGKLDRETAERHRKVYLVCEREGEGWKENINRDERRGGVREREREMKRDRQVDREAEQRNTEE